MTPPRFVPHRDRFVPALQPEDAAREFYEALRKRRSIRHFSDRPVSRATIEWIVRCAGSAPSGANKQPWRFVAVQDAALKARIRAGAEEEEREFYSHRASPQWLSDLMPFGTDANKPFLEIAPWLIVAFRLTRGEDESMHYYGHESMGIACGMLLTAAHMSGLATLTHTPSPMGFLNEILGRPRHEKPYLLIPVGYPADKCEVPAAALEKKSLDAILDVI